MASTIRGSDNFDSAGGNAVKAWVNFNGTGTVAIRAAFNVSSITDNGTGDYTVNFTSALADANYCAEVTNNRLVGITNTMSGTRDSGLTTNGVRVVGNNWSSPFSANDIAETFVSILR